MTLEQALDAVGRRLMPQEWQGHEVDLLKRDGAATEQAATPGEEAAATHTQVGRLNRAMTYLLRALSDGDVKAVVAGEHGEMSAFPSSLWKMPGTRAIFRSGELPVHLRVALEGHKAGAGRRWILLSQSDLHHVLGEAAPLAELPDPEIELREWLAKKIEQYAKAEPPSRKHIWMEAQAAFGSRLSYRSFSRIWSAVAPEAWKRPVRARRAKSAGQR
jgi:hypothetical protein